MPLAPGMKDKLIRREEIDLPNRKANEYNIRHHILRYFNDMEEILWILDTLPQKQVDRLLKDGKALNLTMKLTEKLIEKIDPWPIGEDENYGAMAFRVYGNVILSSEPGKCTIDSISRTVSEEEIKLNKRLVAHLDKIRYRVDPCIPDPVCRDPVYIGLQDERAMEIAKEIAKKTNNPFSVSIDAYLDEIGVNEEGWVLSEPTTIDIDNLRWMRWKPRGLKECMEQPPLLTPKRLARGREIKKLTVHSDEWGMRYLVSDMGGDARPITLEEYLEEHKKMKRPAKPPHKEGTKAPEGQAGSKTEEPK